MPERVSIALYLYWYLSDNELNDHRRECIYKKIISKFRMNDWAMDFNAFIFALFVYFFKNIFLYIVYLFDKNNVHTVLWFQAFLFKTNDYMASSNYSYLIRVICSDPAICFQVTNDFIIIIIIMSCWQHGYPWPSLATFSYRSSPQAGLLDNIPYP